MLLSRIDVPVSAARVREELGLPRSTTYHLLNEMVEMGFVVYIPEHRTYGLGMVAYEMASAYTKQQPLVRLARKPLEDAAQVVQGSGHLSRLSSPDITYLQEVRAPRALSLVTDVGVRLPAITTASGRIMLAQLPEVESRAIFATSGATGTWREFRDDLQTFRERGWSTEVEEVSRGQSSVAVAIVDHLGRPAAALAVTAHVDSMTAENQLRVVTLLRDAAEAIAQRMYV